MSDILDLIGKHFTGVTGLKAKAEGDLEEKTYIRPEGTLSITVNNVYDVASYASVSVNVQGGFTPTGNIDITSAGVIDVASFATATISAANPIASFTTSYVTVGENIKEFTISPYVLTYASWGYSPGYLSEGTIYNPDHWGYYALPSGYTVTPTESAQDVGGPNVMLEGGITVEGISSNYVGSNIPRKSSNDLTVDGSTISGPSGYYSEAFSKSVALMALPTTFPTTSTGTLKATIDRSTATRYLNIPTGYNSASAFYTIASVPNMTLPTTFPTTSTGTLKATVDRSTATRYLNIPTGYNSASAFYTIASVPNGTAYPPATISGSSATVTAGTNVLTFSKAISLTPNITTAGYISQGTASNITVTLSAAISTKAAATITPGTTNQTISSKYYLTGTQTIAGDADLVAANIKTGVNIFNVAGNYTADATASAADIKSGQTAYVNGSKLTGTLVTQTYYSGSTTPASSLGNNGDIYLRVS